MFYSLHKSKKLLRKFYGTDKSKIFHSKAAPRINKALLVRLLARQVMCDFQSANRFKGQTGRDFPNPKGIV